MFTRSSSSPIVIALIAVGGWFAPARAQFVPGRVFTVWNESWVCKGQLIYGHVEEIDPEVTRSTDFALVGDCPLLQLVAMSPDGKRLRVSGLWGVLEFDPQGNWSQVLGGSVGGFPGGVTYDRVGNFYVCNPDYLDKKVLKFPADGGTPVVLAYEDNNGVSLHAPGPISVGPNGEVYVADNDKIFRIGKDGVVTLFDTNPSSVPGNSKPFFSVLVDDFGYLHAIDERTWYRWSLGEPSSREIFSECEVFGEDICHAYMLALSPDRSRIYTQTYVGDIHHGRIVLISVDPTDGSFEIVWNFFPGLSFAVVPLRGDVDGDQDTDLLDSLAFAACMQGPAEVTPSECDLADMDADGDVDLFDMRYFMFGYAAFTTPLRAR